MKFGFVLITLLSCLVGCGRTHHAAQIPVAGITVPIEQFTYSQVGSLGGGINNYEGFTFYDDGKFELFATTYTTSGAVTTWTGWYKITGTYSMDGVNVTLNGTVTGGTGDVVPCNTPFPVVIPYTEVGDTITIAPHTYTLETTSGIRRPDVSSKPDTCI